MATAPTVGGITEAVTVSELAFELRLPVWQVLRSVLLWAATPISDRGRVFDSAAMEVWERELLQALWVPRLREPMAVIVGEFAGGSTASPARLAKACLCVAEWSLSHGAVATSLAFVDAAARTWPENARYACVAAKLHQAHGHVRVADMWVRRALSVAAASHDSEATTFVSSPNEGGHRVLRAHLTAVTRPKLLSGGHTRAGCPLAGRGNGQPR